MLIKDIHRFVKSLSKFSTINEGFYAYHCTRADLEDFTDEEHTNVTSGNGQAHGYGTYFEILDKDANADDYLADENANGKQYKVYIDLKENQLLDLDKSFRDNGKTLSAKEIKEFLKIRNLPSQYIAEKITSLKNHYDEFYGKKKAHASKTFIDKFISLIEDANHLINIVNTKNTKNFKINLIMDSEVLKNTKSSFFFYNIMKINNVKSVDDLSNFIQEKYPEQMELFKNLLPFINEKGGFSGLLSMIYDVAPKTLNIIPIMVNNLPLKEVLNPHTFKTQIEWIRKHFDVWGKILSVNSIKSGKPCKYLILWKTKGIAKIVGHRKRRENDLDKQFTDEIEDEKEQDMISGMLDYAG